MGGKKKYINIFGSFTEPFNCFHILGVDSLTLYMNISEPQLGSAQC